ncbi:MAG: hypothetical protein JWR34_1368 [Mycobacterium sp.]|jgi:hypothetical protein|nr:hypothetical protein [Mycobacterium sp.]
MNDPQCPTAHRQPGVPPDLDVPDCGTGPFERMRFVARELVAPWGVTAARPARTERWGY